MPEQRQRRPKGTGTLRHLGGERWQVTVKQNGKRVSRVFRARNATEANRAADAVRVELQTACQAATSTADAERRQRQRWTVEQYAAYYLSAWGQHHLASTTRQRYAQIVKNQVVPHIGRRRMAEVTVTDLTKMYDALGRNGSRRYGGNLSGQTILTVHMVVRAIFSFACDVQKDFSYNPAREKAAKPKVDTSVHKRGLDIGEVEGFVAFARENAPKEIGVAVLLSAYLGTRRGETLALRWSDVDFRASEVTVRRAITETKQEGLEMKTTKTGKQRVIPLDSYTIAELKAIQREQRQQRMALGQGWQGAESPADDYVTSTPSGAVLSPTAFENAFRGLAKRSGVSGITPHILRHAWVSQMIALGFDAVTIATMTGHSPDVLLRTYAHAFDKRKREAVDALGEARRTARAAM